MAEGDGGLTVVAVGVVLGLAASVAVASQLGDALFGVSTRDAGVLSLVTVVLVVTAMLANGVPARRAARIDPIARVEASRLRNRLEHYYATEG